MVSTCMAMPMVQEFNDVNDFKAAIGGEPDYKIDFETYGNGTPVVGEPTADGNEWLNLGIQFAGMEIGDSLILSEKAGMAVSPTHALATSNASNRCSSLITFSTPVISFGVYIVDNETTSSTEKIILKDVSGNIIGDFAMPGGAGPAPPLPIAHDFRGYLSSVPIAEVNMIEANDGEGALLDDVMYSVPLLLSIPNGGEVYISGTSHTIEWSSLLHLDANMLLEYSVNNGSSWLTIDANTENDGQYDWVIPEVTSNQCLVRVTEVLDSNFTDTSDDVFTTYVCRGGYDYVTKWGVYGSGNGEFDHPYDIAVDLSGCVYVVDITNNRIQKFEPNEITGNYDFVTKWGSLGSGDGQFDHPQGVAVDSSGHVYIADRYNHRIQKFTSSGTYLLQWGSLGSSNGQFTHPVGVFVDSSNYVYVADKHNNRIQKFASNGAYLLQWGSSGSGDGQFISPYDIAVDSSDYVYVADRDNNRIQKFTSSGTYVDQWGSLGAGNGEFDNPYEVIIDSEGYVYVADVSNHRIQKFGSNGMFISKWGSFGTDDAQFDDPVGIATDISGYIYVADSDNHRIQKFESEGPLQSDLNNDCQVDFIDFTVTASEWLKCGNPFDSDCGY